MTSFQCFLSVAVAKGCVLHRMNINNTFFHKDLEQEVYVTMSLGFTCEQIH